MTRVFFTLVATGSLCFTLLNGYLSVLRLNDFESSVETNLGSFQRPSAHPSGFQTLSNGTVRFEDSFSACLLIKDDNDILNEWLAYHYFAFDLRYLVVAVDPSSETSPVPILQKWSNLTDMKVLVWSDQDFMPADFLEKGYHISIDQVNADANKSKWHEGFEDPDKVRADEFRIQNHRFRQLTFLSKCLLHMRHQKRTLTMHTDTDEYVVPSPELRQRSMRNITIQSSNQPSFVANLVRRIYMDGFLYIRANLPCLSMPRLLFGSVEKQNDTQPSVPQGFDATEFETLRWRYHAAYNDRDRNAQPKVVVDVSRVPLNDRMFSPKPFSIHRPSKSLCRGIEQVLIRAPQRFPLIVNHYVGTDTRYFARNDSRRSIRAYNFKAHVEEGSDEWIMGWLEGFVHMMGLEKATALLRDNE